MRLREANGKMAIQLTKAEIDAAIASISEGIEVMEAIGEQHTQLPDGQLTRLQTDRIALTALREARARMEGCDRCRQPNCDTCQKLNTDEMCFVYEKCRQAKYKQRNWVHDVDHYKAFPYCKWCGRKLEVV